jgi:hypothetical protein
MAFIVAASIIAGSTIVATTVTSAVAADQQSDMARDARNAQTRQERKIEELKALRQEVVNPYANVDNLSYLASDTSKNLTNAYASLGVATQAAEIQMEQTDMALANTLDTLAATGASAGGATALAQAALRSKKDVSASIEMQEAQNEKLKAQGEQQLQQLKMSEQQRLQNIAISEGQRVQQAEAQGIMYQFQVDENRINADLNRAAGLQDRAMQMEADANASQAAIWSGAVSSIGQVGGAMAGALAGGYAGSTPSVSSVGTITPGGAVPVSGGGGLAGSGTLMPGSDRRLKKNIKLLGYSSSGLNIYAFEYINKKFGEGVFQGVMSDEIPSKAVIKHEDGFDRVDYSKIDVEFKQI